MQHSSDKGVFMMSTFKRTFLSKFERMMKCSTIDIPVEHLGNPILFSLYAIRYFRYSILREMETRVSGKVELQWLLSTGQPLTRGCELKAALQNGVSVNTTVILVDCEDEVEREECYSIIRKTRKYSRMQFCARCDNAIIKKKRKK